MSKNKKKNKSNKSVKSEKPLSREAKKIQAFAYFWCYAALLITLIIAITLWIVFYNIESLREYTPLAALGSGGLGLAAIGVEQMIASARKMPHMFCVAQTLKRKEMTPEKIRGNELDSKEFVYTGMGITIIGAVLITLGVLFTFVI